MSERLFRTIEVKTTVRGKPHSFIHSKPSGYTLDDYRQMDFNAVMAYGNIGTTTIGIPIQ